MSRSRSSVVAALATTAALLLPAASALAAAPPAPAPTYTAPLTTTPANTAPTNTAPTNTAPPAAASGQTGEQRLLLAVDAADQDIVERRVVALGGSVSHRLPLVATLAVTVPERTAPLVAGIPGVRNVSPDGKARVLGSATDGGPASVYRGVVGSDKAESADGADGRGVGVAVIDTGISDVPDLADRIRPVADNSGELRPCMNFSGESDCRDSYGHGTFVAGLIAGNGAASGGEERGTAPGAHLVSVKVAGRDGSSDVSTILAAIQWVVSYKDQYGIRVLNLSLGTDSTQSYRTDPLNFAVERAWAAGITVVVAAGNLGPTAGSVTKPADDPFVLSVGAVDDRGTPGLGDDMLPNFSSRGPTAADGVLKPDVVAPGAHLLSLRSPGSRLETEFPGAGPYRRGSGTSMSAAVVSGAVAVMLQMNPALTPDRIKFALMDTAAGAAADEPTAVGAGEPSAYRAVRSAGPGIANVGVAPSNGLGRLDLSRGSMTLQTNDLLGGTLGVGMTAQLLLWQPTVYTGTTWSTLSWRLSPWVSAPWPGTVWQGKNWQGKNWQGKNWQGASWYGQPDTRATYGRDTQGSASYGAWD